MSTSDNDALASAPVADIRAPTFIDLRVRLIDRLLDDLPYGRLRVVFPNGRVLERVGHEPGPEATIVVHRWRALRRLALGGDIAFGEAYVDGDWSSPDLTAFLRFAARNTSGLRPTFAGSTVIGVLDRVRHWLRSNTRRGSRRNIEFHYDLGNDFYRRWLDHTMLYSSALWPDDCPSLEMAQQLKLDRIRELLRLDGAKSVLEIGCGWGALAATLAEQDGLAVTGITLSPSQLAVARTRVAALGLAGRADLRLQDYRDLDGTYDRIVSIEMFEAVGEAYWPSYFATLDRCLAPGGVAVLQVISIEEERYPHYRRDTDFIQKHVFPGGFLPSPSTFTAAIEKAGLRVTHSETFGLSYARTLAEWRRRFDGAWSEIRSASFDDRFRRLWTYYLSYCEAGFLEGAVDVGLYTIERPAADATIAPASA